MKNYTTLADHLGADLLQKLGYCPIRARIHRQIEQAIQVRILNRIKHQHKNKNTQ